jgi:hypothetical protein
MEKMVVAGAYIFDKVEPEAHKNFDPYPIPVLSFTMPYQGQRDLLRYIQV